MSSPLPKLENNEAKLQIRRVAMNEPSNANGLTNWKQEQNEN